MEAVDRIGRASKTDGGSVGCGTSCSATVEAAHQTLGPKPQPAGAGGVGADIVLV